MIDAFAHLYPPAYMERLDALPVQLPVFVHDAPSHTDVTFRIEELDRFEIEKQAVALGTPAFDELFAPEQLEKACELARIGNDGIAESVVRFPGRLIGVATLPLVGGRSVDAALVELGRAVKQLSCSAVQLYTSAAGKPLDSPESLPLLARIAEFDIPILLHPVGGNDSVLARDYMLWLTFGWPFETSLATTRLAYAGIFEKFPRLKILTHHLGAFIPFMAERIKGVNFTLERAEGIRLAEPILTTLKRFYGDTAVNGYGPALNAGYEFFGADHILFGTDYPFVPIASQQQAVVDWEITAEDKSKILDGNARRLFQL